MNKFSHLHNNNLCAVRNASRYLRNATIHKDLKKIRKCINDISKNFHGKICDLTNEIVTELLDYDAFESSVENVQNIPWLRTYGELWVQHS